MKNYFIILFATLNYGFIQAQESFFDGKYRLELSYSLMNNDFNHIDHFGNALNVKQGNTYISPGHTIFDYSNYTLKISKETKFKNLELFMGAMIFPSEGLRGSKNLIVQSNGGGVFAGVRPMLKKKHWGLTSEFALGIMSFKYYISGVQKESEPFFQEFKTLASGGFGSMASLGAYIEFGRFRINPHYQYIFSGGGNASFTFHGLVVPLAIRLN